MFALYTGVAKRHSCRIYGIALLIAITYASVVHGQEVMLSKFALAKTPIQKQYSYILAAFRSSLGGPVKEEGPLATSPEQKKAKTFGTLSMSREAQSERALELMTLLDKPVFAMDSMALFSPDTWQSLHLLDKEPNVMSTIAPGMQTLFGKFYLMRLVTGPSTDVNRIHRRAQAIKELSRETETTQKIVRLCNLVGQRQEQLLGLTSAEHPLYQKDLEVYLHEFFLRSIGGSKLAESKGWNRFTKIFGDVWYGLGPILGTAALWKLNKGFYNKTINDQKYVEDHQKNKNYAEVLRQWEKNGEKGPKPLSPEEQAAAQRRTEHKKWQRQVNRLQKQASDANLSAEKTEAIRVQLAQKYAEAAATNPDSLWTRTKEAVGSTVQDLKDLVPDATTPGKWAEFGKNLVWGDRYDTDMAPRQDFNPAEPAPAPAPAALKEESDKEQPKIFNRGSYALERQLGFSHGKALLGLAALSGYLGGVQIPGIIGWIKKRSKAMSYFYDQLKPLKDFFLATAGLKKIFSQVPALKHLKDEIDAALYISDPKIVKLRNLLMGPAFKKGPRGYLARGDLIVAIDLLKECREKILKGIGLLGALDAYSSLAIWMSEHYNHAEKPLCFVHLIEGSTIPILDLKDFWHPLSPGAPTLNSINLGRDQPNNAIITGIFESGKSTTLQSIALNVVCAQSLGIGLSRACSITPFASINIYANIKDDIANNRSLFKSEVYRASQLMDQIKKMGAGEFSFTIADATFTGTEAGAGQAAAYAIARYLGKLPNSIAIHATNFLSLAILSRQEPRNFASYILPTTFDGKAVQSYTLTPGALDPRLSTTIFKEEQLPTAMIEEMDKQLNQTHHEVLS